ncbi:MAG: SoxR reducing system RseC family protein [bacterium]|nr:SoxR reducing system RseC family protein [bacterium]
MLEEKGKAVEVKGDTVIVMVDRKDKGHCGCCCLCRKEKGFFFLEAANDGKVKVGDSVIVRIDDSGLLKGVFFIYALPVIGFITGIISAYYVPFLSLKMVIFLSVFTAFWYYGLKKGNETGKRMKPEIIRRDNGTEGKG